MNIKKNIARSQKRVARSSQSGQIIVITLLILLVSALVVLAVASRSLTDVNISRTQDESSKAFAAAETGVEEAVEKIRGGLTSYETTDAITLASSAKYTYKYAEQSGDTSGKAYISATPLVADLQTFQVYLAKRGDLAPVYNGATICILWGNDETPDEDEPAIEASVIYKIGLPDTKIVRSFISYDGRDGSEIANGGCSKTTLAENNNINVTRNFKRAHLLSLPSGGQLQLLRLRLLYGKQVSHYIGVVPTGSSNLPPQGYKIESTGSTAGGTTRKVVVFQSYPSLPAIFDFALYDGSTEGLKKQ
jgi:Tfp pilus assembly protein PilX